MFEWLLLVMLPVGIVDESWADVMKHTFQSRGALGPGSGCGPALSVSSVLPFVHPSVQAHAGDQYGDGPIGLAILVFLTWSVGQLILSFLEKFAKQALCLLFPACCLPVHCPVCPPLPLSPFSGVPRILRAEPTHVRARTHTFAEERGQGPAFR